MRRFSMLFVVASALVTAAAVVGALAALAGCTPAPEVGEARAPIIGGTVDNADPAVVLLFAQVPGQQSGSLCTAELISPHVVLTAAHCVSPEEVGVGAQFTVYVGTNFDTAQAADLHAVSETHFDAAFNTNNLDGGHDIGIAILSKAATVTPIPINRTPLDSTFVGKPVRFVGYGLSNAAQQTGAGTKRQTSTTLTDYTSLLIHFSDGLHETCNGDSGGPAFMTVGGKEVIVGLTSFGDVNCNMGGYDTRVDALLPFIDQYVNKFDPAPAAAPPDMAQAPDLMPPQQPADPSQPSQPSQPSDPSQPSQSQPAQPSAPSPPSQTESGRAVGESCSKDADCASQVCGLGTQGTLVCVGGSADNGVYGGCSLSGRDDHMTLAFLVVMALLLARSLNRRRH